MFFLSSRSIEGRAFITSGGYRRGSSADLSENSFTIAHGCLYPVGGGEREREREREREVVLLLGEYAT
jgi:hypothetical protein